MVRSFGFLMSPSLHRDWHLRYPKSTSDVQSSARLETSKASVNIVIHKSKTNMFMRLSIILILAGCAAGLASGQTVAPSQSPRPAAPKQINLAQATFDLSDFGVRIEPDRRLIVVMAALDAAGFDPTPAGRQPSAFRAIVHKDNASLDLNLRERLHTFFDRNKLPEPATAADQAARYVSLAYALGATPSLEAPARSDELPSGVLEVLDFAPLVREYYNRSGIDERLIAYLRAYQAEGDRLRKPAAEMVRAILSYLHTQPLTITTERVRVKSPDPKKKGQTAIETVQHDRRFFIVPDLLAAPGAINFRVIADDYYAIVPEGTDPTSSELRRAYIQYVVDALVLRANKEIAAHRDQIKQLIDARMKEAATISPDVFVVVSKSLVAAADARFEEANLLAQVDALQRARLAQAKNDATRAAIAREAQSARAAIADETIARLAEDYDNGAALDFYFADQLRDVSASGFDVGNFLGGMMATIDPARELGKRSEVKDAHDRAVAA